MVVNIWLRVKGIIESLDYSYSKLYDVLEDRLVINIRFISYGRHH